jgi:hypothetical protein
VTKNTRDIVISLVALAVIVFGIRYHMMRERLRHADLHAPEARSLPPGDVGRRACARSSMESLYVAEDRLSMFLMDEEEQSTKAFSSSAPCLLIGSK